jgi:hypothetical protein
MRKKTIQQEVKALIADKVELDKKMESGEIDASEAETMADILNKRGAAISVAMDARLLESRQKARKALVKLREFASEMRAKKEAQKKD